MRRALVMVAAVLVAAGCRSTAWRSLDPNADPAQLQRDIAACRLESQQIQGVDPFPTWMRQSAYNDCMTSKGYEPARSGGAAADLMNTPYPCTRLDAEGVLRKQTCTLATDKPAAIRGRHDEGVRVCMNEPMTIAMFDYRSPEGLQAARDHCEREVTGADD